MSDRELGMLYHAVKIYAYIMAHEKSCDECLEFCEMLKKLSEIIGYDFTDV